MSLTIAVGSERSLRTAHFDRVDAEPLVQVGMFCFPAQRQETKQEKKRFTTFY